MIELLSIQGLYSIRENELRTPIYKDKLYLLEAYIKVDCLCNILCANYEVLETFKDKEDIVDKYPELGI